LPCGWRKADKSRLSSDMRLAVYNFGMFRERAASPSNQGFRDREPANLEAVERASGFIGRAGYEGEPDRESWGVQVYPRFYVERGDGRAPSTLSLWIDIESLMAFTYSGVHAEALRHASDWFVCFGGWRMTTGRTGAKPLPDSSCSMIVGLRPTLSTSSRLSIQWVFQPSSTRKRCGGLPSRVRLKAAHK
jgi:hypothetical protein